MNLVIDHRKEINIKYAQVENKKSTIMTLAKGVDCRHVRHILRTENTRPVLYVKDYNKNEKLIFRTLSH